MITIFSTAIVSWGQTKTNFCLGSSGRVSQTRVTGNFVFHFCKNKVFFFSKKNIFLPNAQKHVKKKELRPPDWPQLRPSTGPETEVSFSLAWFMLADYRPPNIKHV